METSTTHIMLFCKFVSRKGVEPIITNAYRLFPATKGEATAVECTNFVRSFETRVVGGTVVFTLLTKFKSKGVTYVAWVVPEEDAASHAVLALFWKDSDGRLESTKSEVGVDTINSVRNVFQNRTSVVGVIPMADLSVVVPVAAFILFLCLWCNVSWTWWVHYIARSILEFSVFVLGSVAVHGWVGSASSNMSARPRATKGHFYSLMLLSVLHFFIVDSVVRTMLHLCSYPNVVSYKFYLYAAAVQTFLRLEQVWHPVPY